MYLLFIFIDTEFNLHRITSGSHGALVTGVGCQKGTLTLSDTWFQPFLGLAYAPILETSTSFPELAVFFSFFTLNIPR